MLVAEAKAGLFRSVFSARLNRLLKNQESGRLVGLKARLAGTITKDLQRRT
jgi:hypothetical protein